MTPHPKATSKVERKKPVPIGQEWCLNMAALEGDAEIGAGAPDHPLRVTTPPAPVVRGDDVERVVAAVDRTLSGATRVDLGLRHDVEQSIRAAIAALSTNHADKDEGLLLVIDRAINRISERLATEFKGFWTSEDLVEEVPGMIREELVKAMRSTLLDGEDRRHD